MHKRLNLTVPHLKVYFSAQLIYILIKLTLKLNLENA